MVCTADGADICILRNRRAGGPGIGAHGAGLGKRAGDETGDLC